ncbi:hypothetical protein PRIPAC_73556 [Pristionchus pacificus]|uniref:Uncharacterized protein n=1 Tax=Pristionchus pacificus TaxID=54126 RepID=A0A2A6BF33_PRIPA|nr:hypothetical protein PRIPAC_73556 [Pristionchus pacificus]|eukprot:PDM64478.1 hypothetical protein PRIPAC_52734 [Pristionchus pacificus]
MRLTLPFLLIVPFVISNEDTDKPAYLAFKLVNAKLNRRVEALQEAAWSHHIGDPRSLEFSRMLLLHSVNSSLNHTEFSSSTTTLDRYGNQMRTAPRPMASALVKQPLRASAFVDSQSHSCIILGNENMLRK